VRALDPVTLLTPGAGVCERCGDVAVDLHDIDRAYLCTGCVCEEWEGTALALFAAALLAGESSQVAADRVRAHLEET